MKRHPDVPHHAIDGTPCDLSELCSPEDLCDCKEKTPAERQLDEGPNGVHEDGDSESKINPTTTWDKDPLAIARMVVANPPACPSWCTSKSHRIPFINPGIERAEGYYWVHESEAPVGSGLSVEISGIQMLLEGVVEAHIFVKADGGTIIDDLGPDLAESLGRTLVRAAEVLRGER